MGGEIAPPKDPFRRWISIDLAILTMIMLNDVPTSFACLDYRTTGPPIEATACLFHKNTVRTRFNGDTFHRFASSFLYLSTIDTHVTSTRQQNSHLVRPFAYSPQLRNRCPCELPARWQEPGETLSRNESGLRRQDYNHFLWERQGLFDRLT